jgi:hypothetical protein
MRRQEEHDGPPDDQDDALRRGGSPAQPRAGMSFKAIADRYLAIAEPAKTGSWT